MSLPVPGKLLSAVFVRYATKMAYLYIKTQCASSPVELRINISKKILNRNLLNNAKHQTLIKYVCNRKRQVHVPALITTQLGLRKTLYHHSESYPKASIDEPDLPTWKLMLSHSTRHSLCKQCVCYPVLIRRKSSLPHSHFRDK